jgi:uncharacterized membrane-anchored protein YhcB (DUF1043 family)
MWLCKLKRSAFINRRWRLLNSFANQPLSTIHFWHVAYFCFIFGTVVHFFIVRLTSFVQAEIQKVDEDITEAINLRADRYEDDKNRLEMQLADLLRQLRSAKDLEALEERMNEVHALVGENGTIEQSRILSFFKYSLKFVRPDDTCFLFASSLFSSS